MCAIGQLQLKLPTTGGSVGNWKRHPRKDLEAVLQEFADHGWRIFDPPKYDKVLCPCRSHYRWIHLTPSNPNYGKQAVRWASRTCPRWKEEDL